MILIKRPFRVRRWIFRMVGWIIFVWFDAPNSLTIATKIQDLIPEMAF